MVLGPDVWRLRRFQTEAAAAGAAARPVLRLADRGLRVRRRHARGAARRLASSPSCRRRARRRSASTRCPSGGARPTTGTPSISTARKELMLGHGKVGRTFHGRVLQVITGSTGLDEFEWGVTLFGTHPDDLKECVYEMRFDEASAHYAEFGPFYTGMVGTLDEVLAALGASSASPRHDLGTNCAELGPCRRRLQRRGGLLAPGQGGPRHPGARPRCSVPRPSLRRWPARGGATAGPWPSEWDLRWVGVPTDEMDDAAYVANGADRCARCKTRTDGGAGPAGRRRAAPPWCSGST